MLTCFLTIGLALLPTVYINLDSEYVELITSLPEFRPQITQSKYYFQLNSEKSKVSQNYIQKLCLSLKFIFV